MHGRVCHHKHSLPTSSGTPCGLRQSLTLGCTCAGQGGSKASQDANGNTHPHTTDAEAQADLPSAGPQHPLSPPQGPPGRNPHQATMEATAVHNRDIAVGSGSEGSQPKRRKRSAVTKGAQARANGGYGHYSAYSTQSGYGHHPIHGHYADYEMAPVHGKGKKQGAHRTPKQDDKGPCLNPACRTTGAPPGPMLHTRSVLLCVCIHYRWRSLLL